MARKAKNSPNGKSSRGKASRDVRPPQGPGNGSRRRVAAGQELDQALVGLFEATFLGHPEGAGGFLRPVEAKRGAKLDVLIDWRDASGAIHGDRVMAEVSGQTMDGRLKARVREILSRTQDPLPALLKKQTWGWQAIPLDRRMQQVISVPQTDLAQDGDWVSVKLDPDPRAAQIKGTVMARLGRTTDLRIENKLTAALFNLPTEFPESVLADIAGFPTRIPEEWVAGREDLRELLTVTVDPPTAKDFDDAISLEKLPKAEGGGWLLGVHIADVSHYVKAGSALDQEAHLRGTSVYFPDECIPMIPERLSSELCSLQEGVDRLTMTAWIRLSKDLMPLETRFSESVIRSRKRLTYDQVKEACLDLNPRSRAEYGPEICEMLDETLVLSRKLVEQRLGRGAINLDTEETEFLFGEDGLPIDARKYAHHDAHRMIESFMLLANEAVATYFTRLKVSTLYRVHDEPDALKLESFAEVARALGFLPAKTHPTPEVLNALLDKIRGGPLEVMLNTLLLRSLKRAEYSVDNIGHSGLALQDYLHFTSPIRRYPDLTVHRWLRHLLRKDKIPVDLKSSLAMVAKQCSDAEQKATEAERENRKWKTCLLMKPKIGQAFEGRIQGFSLKAAFVRLDDPFVEVGVPLGALGGDFTVNEIRTQASSMGGTALFQIGDRVKVEISHVDEEARRVSAWLLEVQGRDKSGKALAFVPDPKSAQSMREADFVMDAPAGRPRGGSRSGGRASGRPSGGSSGGRSSGRSRSGESPSAGAPKGPRQGRASRKTSGAPKKRR